MEAELRDAPHLNQAEIANPQLFAPLVEYFEHQVYLRTYLVHRATPRTCSNRVANPARVQRDSVNMQAVGMNFLPLTCCLRSCGARAGGCHRCRCDVPRPQS